MKPAAVIRRDRLILAVKPAVPGTPGRVLSDKMIDAPAAGSCCSCGATIAKAERVRARMEARTRRAETFLFCASCCDLMANFAIAAATESGSRRRA
ncbi:hypothetical protein K32_24340 [Kaistia sp. 32K]|uniref:hypothetical protein n=1 Tax=Kaistia sp. 32K TaxID=2795690 RepID=UPI0019152E7E|nr:hypothetical protein [Kaistia sp. 32K]BCP53817.1 hypothetical protein K32_24340 [Kaistia sp. 32K]